MPSTSSKQFKRDAKRAREEARAAARRRERQRTIQTAVVVAIALAIGATIIAVSIRGERTAATAALQAASEALLSEPAVAQGPVPACVPEPPPEPRPQLPKPTFSAPEQVLDDASNYRAVIETSCGRLVFQLLEDDAPETVNSFVFLAREGFFDGLEIFRNAPSIAALQTGAGDNTNAWDLGYTLPDEFGRAQAEGGYSLGALAMAKTPEPNTAGSQFFMIYGPTALEPEYTLFGQLVEGSEALASIGAIPADGEQPTQTVVLESVTIEETPGEPLGPLAPVDTPPLPSPEPIEPTEEQSP